MSTTLRRLQSDMLSSDKNVETLAQLIELLKHSLELRTEYARLDVTARVVRLLGAATLAVVLFLILLAVVLFASIAAALWLARFWGAAPAFLAVSAFFAVVLVVVYACRRVWIERPLVSFLSDVLLG